MATKTTEKVSDERLAELAAQWEGLSDDFVAVARELQNYRAGKGVVGGALPTTGRYVRIADCSLPAPADRVSVEQVDRAADALAAAFTWTAAPAGDFDWGQVHTRLIEIAVRAKK